MEFHATRKLHNNVTSRRNNLLYILAGESEGFNWNLMHPRVIMRVNIWRGCVYFPESMKHDWKLKMRENGGCVWKMSTVVVYRGWLPRDRSIPGFSSHPNMGGTFHPGQCHVRLEIYPRFSSDTEVTMLRKIFPNISRFFFHPTIFLHCRQIFSFQWNEKMKMFLKLLNLKC